MTHDTEVLLIRHGETVFHTENRYAGSTDVSLTERGLAQAAALGEWAATAGLNGLFTSTLSRAIRTAEPAAARTGLQATADGRLVEPHFGDGEGLTAADMRQRFPQARQRFEADPVGHHLPAGEHPEAAARRGESALADITRAYPGGRVLVIAHSTLLRLVLCSMLEIPLHRYRTVLPTVGNCRGARLRYREGTWAMLAFNEALGNEALGGGD